MLINTGNILVNIGNKYNALDGVLRAAAGMIGGVPRCDRISDYIRDTLHWLPVRQRNCYRCSSIVWSRVLGFAPTYL